MTGAEGRTRTGTDKRPKDFKSFASTNSATPAHIFICQILSWMEAAPGIEPGVRVLQTPALPLGYAAPRTYTCNFLARSSAVITQPAS